MSAGPCHPPNRQLAWERLERGWSHDELCTQIKRSMRDAGDADTGLTANTVRRWETGERWPEPRFRKHLVHVFGMPASELGLLTQDEQGMRPDRQPSLDALERLLRMAGDQAAGYGISRQRFLHALLGAGAIPALAPWGAAEFEPLDRAKRRARLDPRMVDSYQTITGQHRELYWTAPAAALLPTALSHSQLGVELLSGGDGQHRHVLAGAVAESALLGARLAFFDLQQPSLAERCFEIATIAVRESGDHALAVAVTAHRSFVPGFAGDRTAARPLLDAARAHARYAEGPLLRSWLHCVQAEVSARTGDAEQSV
ncbi:MAG: helix-turn-helix domain-containing protein, partial [Pseudonocardiaceae bacterium]